MVTFKRGIARHRFMDGFLLLILFSSINELNNAECAISSLDLFMEDYLYF